MKVSLIAALSENRVIGADGDLPWRLPDDMKRFMLMTRGHCVVMGRKTFDSMDRKPLPRRTNIVLSRAGGLDSDASDLHVVSNLEAAFSIATAQQEEETFVIGGEAIYALALARADCLYLTRVHARVEGQVLFPAFDESEWTLAKSEEHDADARHEHAFTYEDWVRA
jgi:dihydrofolate reductase